MTTKNFKFVSTKSAARILGLSQTHTLRILQAANIEAAAEDEDTGQHLYNRHDVERLVDERALAKMKTKTRQVDHAMQIQGLTVRANAATILEHLDVITKQLQTLQATVDNLDKVWR